MCSQLILHGGGVRSPFRALQMGGKETQGRMGASGLTSLLLAQFCGAWASVGRLFAPPLLLRFPSWFLASQPSALPERG